MKLSISWPRPGLLFSSGRHKPVHGGFAAAVRAAETREKSSPDLELRIRGNQETFYESIIQDNLVKSWYVEDRAFSKSEFMPVRVLIATPSFEKIGNLVLSEQGLKVLLSSVQIASSLTLTPVDTQPRISDGAQPAAQ